MERQSHYGQCHIDLFLRNSRMDHTSLSVSPYKPFQTCLMFGDKAKSWGLSATHKVTTQSLKEAFLSGAPRREAPVVQFTTLLFLLKL
jgi:hypothetical protein